MRRSLSALSLLAACSSPSDEPIPLAEVCWESSDCVVETCADEHQAREDVQAQRPGCADECGTVAECDACFASAEYMAWDAELAAAGAAWGSCIDTCAGDVGFEDDGCLLSGEQTETCAVRVGVTYGMGVLNSGADDAQAMCAEAFPG